jgi:Antp family protein
MYYSTTPGVYYMDAASMNSYFEQSGFYGQGAGGPEQAYRFPLGLAGMGVSPYGQHQPRSHQDYDAAAVASVGSVAASPKAAGLYSPLSDSTASLYKTSSSSAGSGGTPGSGTGDCKDTNGYSSLSKDLNAAAAAGWNSGSAAAIAAAASAAGPVRPSACTPDMSRYTPSAVDAAAARDRWMNTCSGLTSASQGQSLQQSANHTFYPWMAIAGKAPIIDIFMTMTTSLSILKFVSVFEEIR